jgi:hypothetical protein
VELGIKRFRDWVKADVFKRMFDAVSDDPDMEYTMLTPRSRATRKGASRARPSAAPEAA